jgi:transcriptional regulator GlxA family with amidase domain
MKHISILALEGEASLSNLETTYKMFNMVNGFLANTGKPPLFKVQMVGLSKETRLTNGLFTVIPELTIDEVTKTDLIIIPAVHGPVEKILELNNSYVPWITQQYKQGAEVASLCIGAFLLASTGLLNGRECSTHWLSADDFRRLFPEVKFVPDKIITDEHGLYSSGGALSSVNLIIYLIEKFAGRDMAIMCSKVFQVELDRHSQSPFIIFKGQKEHSDDLIHKAQEYIEKNYAGRITVDQLADMLALNRRSLERRFKKATSNTLIEYIQSVKVEAAKKSLESSGANINEVMYMVGYTDNKAFRTTFKKTTGLSPVEYRNKYNRAAASRLAS